MRDIIVEFAGWVQIAPENVTFINIDKKGGMPPIDGFQWLALSEEERGDYILESVIDVQRDCRDGNYVQIDVFEDDSI